MLGWAKGLFSSQPESKYSQEDSIDCETDKIIQETETTSSLSGNNLAMDTTPREPASDQLSGTDQDNGTSSRKSKKSKKKNKKIGGSASVLQREYRMAGSEGSPEIGASELDPSTSPTPPSAERSRPSFNTGETSEELPSDAGTAKSNTKKERRRRQESNHNTHSEDQSANGPVAGSESYPSEQIYEPEETLESANIKLPKPKQKRKHRKSHQEELQTGAEDHTPSESIGAAQLADAEHQELEPETHQDSIAQEDTTTFSGSNKKRKRKKSIPVDQSMTDVEMANPQETAISTNSVTKKKERRKKRRSNKSHSASLGEGEILPPEEPEDQANLTHAEENKKKSKSGKAVALGTAEPKEQAQDQVAQSPEETTAVEILDNHSAEQFHLPKSNTGKRKKLQQSMEETGIQDQDTETHALDKTTLPQPRVKKYIAKPKTSKVNRTEAGDANSAALLNQLISGRKKSQLESNPVVPSAKALGKRPARDEPVEHQSKKRKQIDADPRNGDIRSMFSDDAPQHGSSSVAASKTNLKANLPALNVEVAISSPAVKTSRSANQEMAGWTASDRRSTSAENNQDSSDDASEFEEQSGEASVTRRKRYLPVDEPTLVALETPKSGKNPMQKAPKSEKTSSKKLGKAKKDASSKAKPKRSRSQSVVRPKDGNGRFDEDETKKIADAVELYRADNDMEQQAVNSIIQGNALTDGKKFWDFMKEEVPDVPKRNLQSWCRRNFHNYAARGVWSTEQDEELMEVFKRLPKKWSLIGAELNRLPDDCRDRWRNYLSVTNLELGPWKLEEEQQLKDAVKKCIELIREDRRREGLLTPEEEDDDTYHEHDISWMKVSELMDLSRSHLQCYRKWKAIKAREHATTDDLVAERIVISNSWNHLKSYRDATKTLAAEKLQFLKAIRDSKAGAESKIDWRAIDKNLDRNHDAMEMRICLRGLTQNIPGHTSKPLQENVKLLIKAFEDSAPHEPEGYVDLPFESTGLKKRTKRSKTSSLFENNPELYDVGGSNSKPKMRHRMLKQDESHGSNSAANAEDGDTVQVFDSAKKARRSVLAKKPRSGFALSTERVMDSDSDDRAPTSAQKPQSEDEDVRKPGSKTKQTPSKSKGHRAARTEILEDGSDDEQERRSDFDSHLDSEDVEMADAQDDSNDEDSNNETSQSVQFNLGGGGSNGTKGTDHSLDGQLSDGDAEEMALDNSAFNHPPVDSDDDSEMQDPDELQVPATPEYELREGHSEMREQVADLDESGQVYEMSESEHEEAELQVEDDDDEESVMDDMSDIPAKVINKKKPGVNGEGDVYFGREASVDLDQ
ncbi:hypothetical protein SBOR_8125 [Sclerotinia borealis F-4128]|uniref:DNA-binding protein REB1 n=1 Tax=Sclerotinia borealis (strain F-4128) TaxID=1432307 RepID=W9C6K9_SCLBF|nr:hypothetical protein SBOR_8125 [Sclerotinia borealis F-4128]